jgi:hypothetical protein
VRKKLSGWQQWVSPTVVDECEIASTVALDRGWAAIESTPDGGAFGVAVAIADLGGTITLATTRTESLTAAIAWVRQWHPSGVACHSALLTRLEAWEGLGQGLVRPMADPESVAATAALRAAFNARSLAHDGGHLTVELSNAAVRQTPGGDILDVRKSRGSICVVKAAAWAVHLAARKRPTALIV